MSSTTKTVKLVTWILLLATITLIIVGVSLYRRRDSELKRFIERHARKKYPHMRIQVGSASFVDNRGIRIVGLSCYDHSAEVAFVEIREIFIECTLSVKNFLYCDFTPRQMIVEQPVIRLDSPDCESIQALLDRFRSSDEDEEMFPHFPVTVNNGRIITPQGQKSDEEFVFESIRLKLTPPETAAAAGTVPVVWKLHGSAANSKVKQLEFDGELAQDFVDWHIAGKASNVDVGPEIIRSFALEGESSELLESFAARTSCTFSMARDRKGPGGIRFEIEGELFQGNAMLPMFEHPVSNVFVRYTVNNDSLQLSRITGRSGPILFLADYVQEGLDRAARGMLRIQLEELPLNNRVVDRLAPFIAIDAATLRESYKFSATAKARSKLERINGHWHPREVSLVCRNLSISSERIPYGLTGLAGTASLDLHETLRFRFDSSDDQKNLKIAGTFQNALTDAVGRIDIQARGYRIDEKLIKSLPNNCRHTIARLNPEGTLDANITIERLAENPGVAVSSNVPTEPRRSAAAVIGDRVTGRNTVGNSTQNTPSRLKLDLVLGARNGSIKFDRFPYRITGISGIISRKVDGHWEFPELRGKAGSADIVATGNLRENPIRPDNLILDLKIDAFGLAFDEPLRAALALHPQYEILRDLNLRGKVNTSIKIGYEAKTNDFKLAFEASPVPEVTSIRPTIFPLELNHLQGKIVYREGELIVENLRGKNRQMACTAGIRCRFDANDGGWDMFISPLSIDQIQIDRELQSAVPQQILNLFEYLRLKGLFNLSGSVRLKKDTREAPLQSTWDTNVVLHQNETGWKTPVKNICGRIGLRGLAVEDRSVQVHGELDLDSLNVKNVHAARIKGPFYFNGNQLLFGRTVPHPTELNLYLDEYLRKQLFSDPTFLEYERARSGSVPPPQTNNGSEHITRGQQAEQVATSAPGFSTSQKGGNPSTYGQLQPLAPATAFPPPIPMPGSGRPSTTVVSADELVGRRPVNALVFNGPLYLNGLIQLQDVPVYQIGFLLKDANLNDATRDLRPNSKKLDGRITIFSQLQGEGHVLATVKGEGGIIIKDAALYELPQIVKILQMLSIREPDQAAFNSSFVDFEIIGRRLKLNRIFLEGNSLSLFGAGWLTLEGHEQILDLTMNSRLGNTRNQFPVISDVIGGAGDQISEIKINGPLSDPVIRAERFPGIKRAWWSIFPQQEDVPANKSPRPPENRDGKR